VRALPHAVRLGVCDFPLKGTEGHGRTISLHVLGLKCRSKLAGGGKRLLPEGHTSLLFDVFDEGVLCGSASAIWLPLKSSSGRNLSLSPLNPVPDVHASTSIRHGLDKCFIKRTTCTGDHLNRGRTYVHYSLLPVACSHMAIRVPGIEGGRNGVLAALGPSPGVHASHQYSACHSALQITQAAKAHGRGKIRSTCMLELDEWSGAATFPALISLHLWPTRYWRLHKNKVDRSILGTTCMWAR